MNRLPTCRAAELDEQPAQACWLIEPLWADQAVGILGGEPKCCKLFFALDIAVAVASGAPCLRRFPPNRTGTVLLFAAEDALHVVRQRLEGIAHAAAVAFHTLDIHLITAPTLRLDLERDQQRLRETVAHLQPKLLVLDPFTRLHRTDENVAAEVAPLLAYLRSLQRHHHTAVLMVHHTRKGATPSHAGQALRGSSELHAWGDSNLYLHRHAQRLRLSVEHRAAPSHDNLSLELRTQHPALALHLLDEPATETPPPHRSLPSALERVEQALDHATAPMSQRQLRRVCQMKTTRIGQALEALIAAGRVIQSPQGYRLADP